MEYDVFYCFYAESDDGVPSTKPVRMPLTAICDDLLPRMTSEGDFIGLIDAQGVTLQACCEPDENCYWVEMPAPKEKGSHGQYCTFDELMEIFKKLPAEFTAAAFPGFAFESWDGVQIVED